MAETRTDDAQRSAYNGEHYLAWIMGIIALALGAIGLLVGFGVFGGDDIGAGDVAGATQVPNWQEGLLWILPAIAAAALTLTLHMSDHHRANLGDQPKSEQSMFGIEHGGAYLMAVLAIGAGALGLLVGFDVFDRGNTPTDGFLWHSASILYGVMAAALHATRHHVVDEDYVVAILERRNAGTSGATMRQPNPSSERVSRRAE